jgi:hypothetical protein
MAFEPIALLLWLMNLPVGPSLVAVLTVWIILRMGLRRLGA